MVWIVLLVLLALFLLVAIWFLQRFFVKASLDTALVRTGFGGRKVVMDGGCFVLPILHQVQKVYMGALTIPVDRSGREAVLTKDQLRADLKCEFELRVAPTLEAIATAAQTLGARIARSGGAVDELLVGFLVNAIQTGGAERTLEEIHLNRSAFCAELSQAIDAKVSLLGLTLVSSSLISVDQSDLSLWNENNAFNAQGMRRLAELVSDQRKARVRIESEAEISVSESRLAQHRRQLDLQREQREAEIAQSEHLAKLEADAKARETKAREDARLSSETSRIENERRTKESQVQNDKDLRDAELTAHLALEEIKIQNNIHLSRKRAEEAEAKAAEETARAQVLLAEESVRIQTDRAIAEREAEVARLRQKKDLELESARIKSDVDTLLAKAQAEASVTTRAAEAERIRMEAEAAGLVALHSAENTLSEAVIRMRLEERKLDRMPEIMTQMMKPVEKIDSIRINQITGLGGTSSPGEGADSAFGAAMDQILGMAVRLPAMKQMGEEIGLDFDPNIAGRTADYANRIKTKQEPKKPDPTSGK